MYCVKSSYNIRVWDWNRNQKNHGFYWFSDSFNSGYQLRHWFNDCIGNRGFFPIWQPWQNTCLCRVISYNISIRSALFISCSDGKTRFKVFTLGTHQCCQIRLQLGASAAAGLLIGKSLSGTTRLAGGFRKNSSFVGVLYATKATRLFAVGWLSAYDIKSTNLNL